MKTAAVVLMLVVLSCCSATAAEGNCYTLYYIDETKNVSAIAIDVDGKPSGSPRKLTTRGGYDSFSVSPNEEWVFGATAVSRSVDKDTGTTWTRWSCFVERIGSNRPRQQLEKLDLMDIPWLTWSPTDGAFALNVGSFDVDMNLYKCGRAGAIANSGIEPVFSADGRFVSVLGTCLNRTDSEFGCWLIDLHTGKSASFDGDGCSITWIGSSYRIVWSHRYLSSVHIGTVDFSGSTLRLVDQKQIFNDGAWDVRYVRKEGLYLLTNEKVPYLSSDLRTFRRVDSFPETKKPDWAASMLAANPKAWKGDAQYSPDGRLLAFPLDKGRNKMPRIHVLNQAGRSHPAAVGKAPEWNRAAR